VKGYSNLDDCLGGEKLAAREFALPSYPRRPFNSGRQGWVIMKLDVNENGITENVEVERSVPDGLFEGASREAVKNWTFEPPKEGALRNCLPCFTEVPRRGCYARELIDVHNYLNYS